MLNLMINNSSLYMGTNAGAPVYHDIETASSNVLVLSPHVSEDHIDLLLKKHAQGVNVMLITSTDFEGNHTSKDIYKKLITQTSIINEKKKRYCVFGLIIAYLLILSGAVTAGVGVYLGKHELFWSLLALPIGLLAVKIIDRTRVYTYTYQSNMPFYVMASPNVDPRTSNQIFVNSKVFIVDEQIAYIGSPNFTSSSFQRQYESLFRIMDINIVNFIYKEINGLISDQGRLFRDINYIGKQIYPEPIN